MNVHVYERALESWVRGFICILQFDLKLQADMETDDRNTCKCTVTHTCTS